MPTTDPLMTGATPADRPPIVALIGLGALGAAHVATMINHDPATVVRVIAGGERGERLRQQGMTANDRTYDLTVVAPGEDSQPPADLVLLAVKAYDLEPAIADIAGQVGPDTVIVSLLNGVASERAVQEAYPDNFVPLAYSILSNAGRDDTGFRFYAVGQIHLGEPTNDPPSARVQRLVELFTRVGLTAVVQPDMELALWRKFVLNVGVNQASALLESPYGPLQQPGSQARQLMVDLMAEALSVSQAHGVALTDADLTSCVATIDALRPEGFTSMAQDARFHRPMEISLFGDEVVQLGRRHNLPTPVNTVVAQALRAKQETWPGSAGLNEIASQNGSKIGGGF